VPGQRRRRGVCPALHRRPDREAAAGITGLGLAGYVEGEVGRSQGSPWMDRRRGDLLCCRSRAHRERRVTACPAEQRWPCVFLSFFLFINICVLCIGHLNWSMDALFFKIVFGFFNGLTNLVILFDISD
jgi:hypothetical protein